MRANCVGDPSFALNAASLSEYMGLGTPCLVTACLIMRA
jgi:hypothetical protein